MPVRTRQERVHTMECDNDDFINVINTQADLYNREFEINQQYGAPLHSMTAESGAAYIHDPPPPISPDYNTVPHSPATPPITPPITPPVTTPVTPPPDRSLERQSYWNIISQYNTYIFNTKCGIVCWYTFKFFSILMVVSFIHWILVSIYMKWCYEPTLLGIFANVFMVSSPLCTGINNLQQAMSNNFISFWLNGIVMTSSFVKTILVM